MLSFFKSKAGYSCIEEGDYEGQLKLGDGSHPRTRSVTIRTGPWSMLVLAILFLSSIASTWTQFFSTRQLFQQSNIKPDFSQGPTWVCQRPTTRREWRTLSKPERMDYVTAVKCLATKPSKLRNNGTLYDDFPWVHKHLSSKSASSS